MKIFKSLVTIAVLLVLTIPGALAIECGNTPTNHCTITQDTVLANGNYLVTNMTFAADNVKLDCNGATLNGSAASTIITPLIDVGGTSGNTIQNCNMVDYYSGAIADSDGLSLPEPSGYFIIQHNTFNSPTVSNAIGLFEPLAPSRGRSPVTSHTIFNNTVTGNHNIGFNIHSANRSYIAYNTIQMGGGTGSRKAIILEGGSYNLIEGNTLNEGKILLLRGQGTALNNTFRFNTIENAQTGLEIWEGSPNTYVEENTFRNNNLAIYVRASEGTYRGNTIESTGTSTENTLTGITFDSTTNPRNNQATFNNFINIDDPFTDQGINNSFTTYTMLPLISLKVEEYGNYYSQYASSNQMNSKGEPCSNLKRTNVCDNPYYFLGNNDSAPLRSSQMSSVFAPIIEPIPPLTINESEAATITINATGFNETLTYAVEDSRFVQLPGMPANQFIWQTNFNNAGQHSVNITVTDPFNIASREAVSITILEANEDCSLYPTRIANSCVVKNSITFPTGNYYVPDGISIGANAVSVDCNGATLLGNNQNTGITIKHYNAITTKNCVIKQYALGMNLTNTSFTLVDNIQSVENVESNGINLFTTHNTIIKNSNFSNNADTGIHLYNSDNNLILNNKANNNDNRAGIALYTSTNNTIQSNTVKGNDNAGISLGIWLGSGPSNTNTLMDNTIANTRQNYGIDIRRGNNNFIYHNNLINNKAHARDLNTNTGNQWSLNNEGNHYTGAGYTCIGNHKCNNPFSFLWNTDPHPFRDINGWLYPEPHVLAPATAPIGGSVNITLVGSPKHAGEPYYFAFAFDNTTGIPLPENRLIYLNNDILFRLSLQVPAAFGLQAYTGNLDANGNAVITWNVPPSFAPLQNVAFYAGGFTFDFTRPIFFISAVFVPEPIVLV